MATLVRWDPLAEMGAPTRMLDRLFDDLMPVRFVGNGQQEYGFFPLDVSETAEAFEVSATLPGVNPEEVQIQIHGSTITIKGESKLEQEEKGKTYLRRERRHGMFARSLTLPSDLDADQATARFEAGVLKLQLPKSEAMKPKQVKVVMTT